MLEKELNQIIQNQTDEKIIKLKREIINLNDPKNLIDSSI